MSSFLQQYPERTYTGVGRRSDGPDIGQQSIEQREDTMSFQNTILAAPAGRMHQIQQIDPERTAENLQPTEPSNPLLRLLLLGGAGVGGYYLGGYLGKGKKEEDYYRYGGAAVGVIGLYLIARSRA